jgi:hypothetical protein
MDLELHKRSYERKPVVVVQITAASKLELYPAGM